MNHLKNAGNPNWCAMHTWNASLIAVLLIASIVAGCAPAATRSDSTAEPQAAGLRPLPAIINPINVSRLTLLREWEVDRMHGWRSILWFPDGARFIVPRQGSVSFAYFAGLLPGPMEGIHCFDADSGLPEAYVSLDSWNRSCDVPGFHKSHGFGDGLEERVVFNDPDFFYIMDGQEMKIESIPAGELCGGIVISTAVAIPGRDEILIERGDYPGHQPPEGAAGLYLWKDGFCSPFLQDETGSMTPLVVSSDGKYVFYYDDDWDTRVYDIEKGEEVCHLFDRGLAFDQQNRLILKRWNDVTRANGDTELTSTIFEVDLPDCAVQEMFTVDSPLHTFSLHPSGELLAGEIEESLVIWNLKTGEIMYQPDLDEWAASGNIGEMAFSPDGRYLALIWYSRTEGAKDKILLLGVEE